MRLDPNAVDRVRSVVMDLGFETMAPDAQVVMWMQSKLAPYQKARPVSLGAPGQGSPVSGNPLLPANRLTTQASEKGYSTLETSKSQAVCGLTDAQWDTELPGLYPRMLEEGRTLLD